MASQSHQPYLIGEYNPKAFEMQHYRKQLISKCFTKSVKRNFSDQFRNLLVHVPQNRHVFVQTELLSKGLSAQFIHNGTLTAATEKSGKPQRKTHVSPMQMNARTLRNTTTS